MSTTPMFAPDGTLGDIPSQNVGAALKAGGKLGIEITSPEGKPGVVPIDRVHEAVRAGGILKGAAPPAAPSLPAGLQGPPEPQTVRVPGPEGGGIAMQVPGDMTTQQFRQAYGQGSTQGGIAGLAGLGGAAGAALAPAAAPGLGGALVSALTGGGLTGAGAMVGGGVGQAVTGQNPFNPANLKQNVESGAYMGATAIPAELAVGSLARIFRKAPATPLSGGAYSPQGDKLATVVKPVRGLDMPAATHNAIPELRESAADLGVDPATSFHPGAGREGTLQYDKIVQNAIKISEDRAAQVMAPIIDRPAPARMLANSPELAAYLDVQPGENITNQMVNDARKEANGVLTRGNDYLKPRSKQFAPTEATIDARKVASQARDVLYTQAEDATGIDLRPLRAKEANLINLSDSSQATHNALSRQQAEFETASPATKAAGMAKSVIAAKANPLGAIASSDTPTFMSPLRKFNGAMRDVFEGVTPQRADRTFNGGIRAPGNVSVFTSPRALPQDVPGYNTPVPGSTPFAPPGYQLGPAPPQTFPQTNIQGAPYIPRREFPLALPGTRAPIYAEPPITPPSRQLPARSTPATRSIRTIMSEAVR